MSEKNSNKIIIKIFSDLEDASFLKNIINPIYYDSRNVEINISNKFYFEDKEILLFFLSKSDSYYFNLLADDGKFIMNKSYFICQNDALIVSRLVKLGFSNIYVYPDEVESFITQFRSYLDSLEPGKPGMDRNAFDEIIGESESIKKVKEYAKKVIDYSSSNILILGETGTGKGLLAKALHKYSSNNESPFVDIICSAIPESLLESELFGYEQGAFTNALDLKPGLFELAGNGTLFLDEIGDLSLNIQSKLLRVIEKKIIRRLGGLNDIPVNARIISATNRDLKNLVSTNNFREDLFHRLNIITFILPPLRERQEDIPLLTEHFLIYFNQLFSKKIYKIEKSLSDFLILYKWPGNVRELKNLVERAVLVCEGNMLKLEHFQSFLDSLIQTDFKTDSLPDLHPYLLNLIINFQTTNLKKLDKLFAHEVFNRLNRNKSLTSKILGVSRPKLDELLQ